jgi:hypothetical protein
VLNAETSFTEFKDGVPLNLNIKYPRFSMLKEGLSIDATFNPSQFSSDYTFNRAKNLPLQSATVI